MKPGIFVDPAKDIPRISLARLPTPLTCLERLSKEQGGPRIWIKRDDLTETAISGNKLRKLEFTAGEAQTQQATVLITSGGIQSNHCRATAIVAARLGMKCHLILRGKPDKVLDGNLLLDNLVGASFTFATAKQFKTPDQLYADVEEHYRALGEKPFSIPLGASDEIGLWGYIECARELKSDFQHLGIHPEHIISATGSGGTMGGLIVGNVLHELNSNIMAFNVCDDEAWFQRKISRDIRSWIKRYKRELPDQPINIIDGYVGPGYGRADPHVYETIRHVARAEGIILDPVYTGKAFDAFLQELAKGRFRQASDIVFLHTGGIFGLFPHRDLFADALLTDAATPQP